MLIRSTPVLHVSRAAAAEPFYCGRLDFERRFAYRPDPLRDDPCYLGVLRDGVWLHLSSFPGDGFAGAVVNLYVDDVDALHAELLAAGVEISMPPTEQSWGTREMYVRDPDGNCLRWIESGGS